MNRIDNKASNEILDKDEVFPEHNMKTRGKYIYRSTNS